MIFNIILVVAALLFGVVLPWLLSTHIISPVLDPILPVNSDSERRQESHPVEWVGNTMLWTGDYLASPSDIQQHFENHSMLVIGDRHDARLYYGMLMEVLFMPLVDGNNHQISRNVVNNMTLLDQRYVADGSTCGDGSFNNDATICQMFHRRHIDFVQLECFRDVQRYLHHQSKDIGKKYDTLVIATGRAETAIFRQRKQCSGGEDDWLKLSFTQVENLLETLEKISVPFILWKNGAYSQESQLELVEQMSRRVKDSIALNGYRINVLDYQSAVRDRINVRIPGERGLLFMQLLMNWLLRPNGAV